jgi:V8-like Glu-specific endopeptidase
MPGRRFFVAFVVVMTAGFAAIGSLASASGTAESASGRVTTHGDVTRYHVSVDAQRATVEYWTPARMAAAQPRAMSLDPGAARTGGPADVVSGSGSARFIPGRAPTGPAEPPMPPPEIAAGAAAVGYTYPFPFSGFEIPGLANYSTYPYSAVGKIFATDAQGDYTCSGAAVVSANESVVWTAGHCLYLIASGWFTNLIFVPGYRDGAMPFGQWVAVDGWTTNGWFNSEDFRADLGAVVIAPSPTGATLADSVGYLGFAYAAGRVQHWESFGYPAVPPFNGERQHVCSASFATVDSSYRRRPTVAIGCDMTEGSSGGPWILDFGGGNYVNGVNSYGIPGLFPNAMFGPYFGAGAGTLLGCAEDGVC